MPLDFIYLILSVLIHTAGSSRRSQKSRFRSKVSETTEKRVLVKHSTFVCNFIINILTGLQVICNK